jgi:hypothetical protein
MGRGAPAPRDLRGRDESHESKPRKVARTPGHRNAERAKPCVKGVCHDVAATLIDEVFEAVAGRSPRAVPAARAPS